MKFLCISILAVAGLIEYVCPLCKRVEVYQETSYRQHFCYGSADKPHPKHLMIQRK